MQLSRVQSEAFTEMLRVQGQLLGILLSAEDPRILTIGQAEVRAGAGAGEERVKSELHVPLCPAWLTRSVSRETTEDPWKEEGRKRAQEGPGELARQSQAPKCCGQPLSCIVTSMTKACLCFPLP